MKTICLPGVQRDEAALRQRHLELVRVLRGITNDINNVFAALKGQVQLARDEPLGVEPEDLKALVLESAAKVRNILQAGAPFLADELDADLAGPAEEVAGAAATRMLVVDDEESMRRVIGRILERNGYAVTSAASGEEALRAIREHRFDIAFVDLRLGDMSGLDVAQELRKVSPTTHVIFVSGDPLLDRLKEQPPSGQAAFVKKPFDVQEVNELVSYILTMRAALAP